MSKTEWTTTDAHFRAFSTEVHRLVRLWGINDWIVKCAHMRLTDARAQCMTRVTHRVCTIALGKVWMPKDGNGDEHFAPTLRDVKETARHEVIHLLLARVQDLGTTRFVTEDESTQAIEGLCRHLHDLLPR